MAQIKMLRQLWFQVHLWLGVALAVLLIPIGLTGTALVWTDELLRAGTPHLGAASQPASAYLDAAKAALPERARVVSLAWPEQPGDPVQVVARPGGPPRNDGGRREGTGGDGRASRGPGEARGANAAGAHEAGEGGALRGRHGGDGDHGREEASGQSDRSRADRGAEAAAPRGEEAPRAGGEQAGPPGRGGGEAAGQGGRGRQRPITVKLDPATARVLNLGGPRPEWWRTVHGFHENLMQPGWGRPVVGWLGVGLLISALTGIWLWWPRSGRLGPAFRFQRAPGFWRSLHFTAGFWISLPLAFVALTGVGLGFPQQTRALIGAVAPISPPGNGNGMGGPPGAFGSGGGGERGGGPWRPQLDADRALAAAGVKADAARSLTLPSRAKPVWRVELRDGSAREVGDADGRVSQGAPPPAGDQAWRWLHRLHGGDGTTLAWRLIVTLTGLAPALFGITGIALWLARRSRRAKLAAVPA